MGKVAVQVLDPARPARCNETTDYGDALRGDLLMDRDEAMKLLRGGAEGIAEWNRRRPVGKTILILTRADLSGADLTRAVLTRTVLEGARLDGANLTRAVLTAAGLQGADLSGADLSGADLSLARLSGARLDGAVLDGANLFLARLDGARLNGAILGRADLTGAHLNGAILDGAHLNGAILDGAHLDGAHLNGAILDGAHLDGAILHGAFCQSTIFADVDLSQVEGLDSIVHRKPSHVSTSTLIRSRGKIPEAFLRGCGLPDVWISYLPELIGGMQPFQFHTVFLSYSTRDEEFTSKLHKDLEAAGVRCWKWDHDARTGQPIWGEIDRNIPLHDKLVLIASESSLKSPQVNREIERAIQEEDRRAVLKADGKYDGDTNVLFPVRLDDYVFSGWSHPRKADVTTKMIADARGWEKGRKVYTQLLDRLLRDLKSEGSPATKNPAE